MDDNHNEIHHVQFGNGGDEVPASITILIRHNKQPAQPITKDDLLDIHTALHNYQGRITPYLK